MANLSIKSKLLVMLLAVSLFSIAVVASLNYYTCYQTLQERDVLAPDQRARVARRSDRTVLQPGCAGNSRHRVGSAVSSTRRASSSTRTGSSMT